MPRFQVILAPELERRAKAIKKLRAFTGEGLSDIVQALIREEWERRQPPTLTAMEVKEIDRPDLKTIVGAQRESAVQRIRRKKHTGA